MAQEFEKHVVGYAGAGVAEVGVTIYGGAADIHPDVTGIYRFEDFLVTCKGICEEKSPELFHITKIIKNKPPDVGRLKF
jgi:hypothetical protein